MNVSCALGRRQRGVVLFVALIVLIIMTLAGLALLRQMGAGSRSPATSRSRKTRPRSPTGVPSSPTAGSFSITRSLPPIRSPTATSRTGEPASIRPPSTGMRSRSCSSTTRRRPATGRASSSIGCASSRTGVRSLRTRTARIRRSSTPAARAAGRAIRASFRAPPASRSSGSRPASTDPETRPASPKFWFSNCKRRPK